MDTNYSSSYLSALAQYRAKLQLVGSGGKTVEGGLLNQIKIIGIRER